MVDRSRELTIVTRPESEGVRVEVGDNGVDIEKEKLKSIFQPFYTTKAAGMGLGLSISRSIIKSHGGQLIAQPNNGPGTTSISLSPETLPMGSSNVRSTGTASEIPYATR